MNSDRQITACNSTMICQWKIPSGTLPKPGILPLQEGYHYIFINPNKTWHV